MRIFVIAVCVLGVMACKTRDEKRPSEAAPAGDAATVVTAASAAPEATGEKAPVVETPPEKPVAAERTAAKIAKGSGRATSIPLVGADKTNASTDAKSRPSADDPTSGRPRMTNEFPYGAGDAAVAPKMSNDHPYGE